MFMNLFNVYLLMFMVGGMVFVSNRKHLLINLLSLEFLMLILFINLFSYLVMNSMELYFLMIFLVFLVCEGVLGLSILVSMIRTHGNNYFQSFNLLLC